MVVLNEFDVVAQQLVTVLNALSWVTQVDGREELYDKGLAHSSSRLEARLHTLVRFGRVQTLAGVVESPTEGVVSEQLDVYFV